MNASGPARQRGTGALMVHPPSALPDVGSPAGPATTVLFVIGTLQRGGAEGQLVTLATRLDRRRFRPHVLCLTDTGPLARPLQDAGVPVELFGFKAFIPARGFGLLRAMWLWPREILRLSGTIRRIGPDIIHGFLFWAYVLGTLAGRLAGVPVRVASRRSLSEFKAQHPRHRRLEHLANRWVSIVVANSEAVRQDSLATERLRPSQVRVIHNGVRRAEAMGPRTLAREALGIPTDAIVATVVANLIAYKGHEVFLHSWAKSWRPGAVALLVGDGPERARLERIALSLGLPSGAVRFLGTRADVPDVLGATDLFVLPSFEEGFSNAILEAMAAGAPVIATDVGGNREAVVDGVTGLIVAPRDVAALADALSRLLGNADVRRRLGRAGRTRAEQIFSIDAMVHGYESLYEEQLAVARHGQGQAPGQSAQEALRKTGTATCSPAPQSGGGHHRDPERPAGD